MKKKFVSKKKLTKSDLSNFRELIMGFSTQKASDFMCVCFYYYSDFGLRRRRRRRGRDYDDWTVSVCTPHLSS
jgi:hypothetical protein